MMKVESTSHSSSSSMILFFIGVALLFKENDQNYYFTDHSIFKLRSYGKVLTSGSPETIVVELDSLIGIYY